MEEGNISETWPTVDEAKTHEWRFQLAQAHESWARVTQWHLLVAVGITNPFCHVHKLVLFGYKTVISKKFKKVAL